MGTRFIKCPKCGEEMIHQTDWFTGFDKAMCCHCGKMIDNSKKRYKGQLNSQNSSTFGFGLLPIIFFAAFFVLILLAYGTAFLTVILEKLGILF